MNCEQPVDTIHPDTKQKYSFPCRKCSVCKWRRASSLRGRMHCEQLYKTTIDPSAQGSMITLTYEQEPETTKMNDIKNFKQRFRKLEKSHGNKQKITFSQVSELGLKYGRLHWHIMTFGNKHWYSEEVQKWLWPHGFLTFRPINAETIGYLTQYVQNPSDLHQQNSWSNGLGKQGLWYLLDLALQKARGSSNWDMNYNISYIQWGKNKFSLDQTQRKWFDQWLETNKLDPFVPNIRQMEDERKLAILSPFPDHETIKKEIQYFQRTSSRLKKDMEKVFIRKQRAQL